MKKGETQPIYFISDLHIGLQDEKSEQLKMENLERLFAIIKAEGRSLYMLGDIVDYWMEFRHLIPKGFTWCATILRLFMLQETMIFISGATLTMSLA